MKLEVNRNACIKMLQRAQGIALKKDTLPILAFLLMKSDGETAIQVMATDLEITLWTRMEARIIEGGSATLPVKKALEIMRNLSSEWVSIDCSNAETVIKGGRSSFKLPAVDPHDFPSLEAQIGGDEQPNFVAVNGEAIERALSKIGYAMPKDSDPFSVRGVFFHIASGKYRFVASDGHRVAYSEVQESSCGGLSLPKGIVLPKKGVLEMLKMLESADETSMAILQKSLIIKTPEATLGIQLLDEEYPEYWTIFPEDPPGSLALKTEDLTRSLKRMGVMLSGEYKAVRLRLSPGDLTLEARSQDLGEGEDHMEVDYDQEAVEVAFNLQYVQEVVATTSGGSVRFQWLDNIHGCLFSEPGEPGTLHLIMPMVV